MSTREAVELNVGSAMVEMVSSLGPTFIVNRGICVNIDFVLR